MKISQKWISLFPTVLLVGMVAVLWPATRVRASERTANARSLKDIKAYCIDYTWATHTWRHVFARPGSWSGANPADYVKWYKTIGANVISRRGHADQSAEACLRPQNTGAGLEANSQGRQGSQPQLHHLADGEQTHVAGRGEFKDIQAGGLADG